MKTEEDRKREMDIRFQQAVERIEHIAGRVLTELELKERRIFFNEGWILCGDQVREAMKI